MDQDPWQGSILPASWTHCLPAASWTLPTTLNLLLHLYPSSSSIGPQAYVWQVPIQTQQSLKMLFFLINTEKCAVEDQNNPKNNDLKHK